MLASRRAAAVAAPSSSSKLTVLGGGAARRAPLSAPRRPQAKTAALPEEENKLQPGIPTHPEALEVDEDTLTFNSSNLGVLQQRISEVSSTLGLLSLVGGARSELRGGLILSSGRRRPSEAPRRSGESSSTSRAARKGARGAKARAFAPCAAAACAARFG